MMDATDALQDIATKGTPEPVESIQEELRRIRKERDSNTGPDVLAIPGYGGRLAARYRRLSYEERRNISTNVIEKHPDATVVQRELYTAADCLIASCIGTEAHRGDEVIDLGKRLGLDLAEYLGMEGAETHRQAVFAIFPEDSHVMTTYGLLLRKQTELNVAAEAEALGNSNAAIS